MSNPNESDPFNPSTWSKTNSNTNPNEPQPINYNQQPPNYNQQIPNYNQQVPPGGYQQNFPPPGYNPYMNPPQGSFGMQEKLPNSGGILTMGILSIVFIGVIGIILGIITLSMSGNAMRLYQQFPGRFTEESFRRVKTGRICATIGLSLIGLIIVILIVLAIAINS